MRTLLAIILLSGSFIRVADAQLLKEIEPGIGYARFKQWAIEHKLVFENFTRDSLVVRDRSMNNYETLRMQIRFCGGDDFAGRAFNITIQEQFSPELNKIQHIDAIARYRDHIEFLSEKAAPDGKLPGNYALRRDRKDGNEGVAIGQENDQGYWEVGLFKTQENFVLLQTIRRRDSICK